jgi:hypothetical protein
VKRRRKYMLQAKIKKTKHQPPSPQTKKIKIKTNPNQKPDGWRPAE